MEKKYPWERAEREMQNLWDELGVYRFPEESAKEIFSIDTPPPTVSGSLHIGHIFSYTQAEMIARFQRMQGYRVFYPFGFDDNGLPSERLVEKELGIRARDWNRGEFTQCCRQITSRYEGEFKQLWKSLGFSVDWSLQYQTISPLVSKISQRSFLELVRMKKAYCRKAPVLWCTECQTSIAQAELDSKEIGSSFHYLPFVSNQTVIKVATTRPELLYGCVCLFVHPDDPRYFHLAGKKAKVPLYGFEIPILADRKVDPQKGTGAVMCATFGDSTDAEWFEEYQLPYRKIICPDGRIAESVPELGGLTVTEARKKIVHLLKEKGLLLRSEEIRHYVAVHERCGTEVEIIPSRQWYIDILTNQEQFYQAADEISWYPPAMKTRYQAWVKNLKWDWCISRQRYFGIPIPVWYCRECGKPVFAREQQLPVNPLESEYQGKCSNCGCEKFEPESAVLDTWATSSLTPQINARYGEEAQREYLLPMSMRTQAHEIIRTWAFYTIVKSLYHTGEIPWKDIMICGYVLAKKGEKLSKSKDNSVLSPQELIKCHSADALRYWAANARLGTDTFFSEEELSISHRFLTKLWNAARFAVSRLDSWIPFRLEKLLPIDLWIIERTNQTIREAAEYLKHYEIGLARHAIDELFWKDFCDYYIEIAKERLYQPEFHGESETNSAKYALFFSFLQILKLYAPFVPHITEYIYQQFYRKFEKTDSIHQTVWNKPEAENQKLLQFGEILKERIAQMRKWKSERGLSLGAPMDCFIAEIPAEMAEWFQKSELDLKSCSKAREVRFQIQ